MATAKKTPAAAPAPAAKAPKATKAPGKPVSTALVPWEEEMAKRAKKAAKHEVPYASFKKISTQGGILKVDDEAIADNSLDIVIIGALHENQWYSKPFDPRAPTVPDCYAFNDPDGDEDTKPEDTMVAHAEAENPQGVEDPNEQGANGNPCNDCWANRMGSADTGRGKACKNIRRLAVITADALEDAESLANAEVRALNVPVMSTFGWAKYVNKLADDMGRDYAGVITTLSLVPDPKSQFKVEFAFNSLINFDQGLWEAMEAKRKDAMASLLSPYPKQADLDANRAAQAPAPRGRAGAANAARTAAAGKKAPPRTGKF
jgi:hypothetical protein